QGRCLCCLQWTVCIDTFDLVVLASLSPPGAAGQLIRFHFALRFVFAVAERNSSVTVRVVPCDAPLQWNLTLREPEEDPSEDASGGPHPLRHRETRLFSYRGNDVETFSRAGRSAGRYTLELLCTERDTGVRVWAGVGPERPYPSLPRDPRLEVAAVGHTSLSLVWKPSPDIAAQYCALVSRRHNYKSLCAPVIGATGGHRVGAPSRRPPSSSSLWPPDAWRTSSSPWGPDVWPRSSSSWRPAPRQPSPRKPSSWSPGQPDSLTVSRLRPGTQYYLDVFAVNPATGAGAAYGGTFELKRGKVTEVRLKGGGSRLLRFRPGSPQRPRAGRGRRGRRVVVVSVWPWARGARTLVSRWVRGPEHLSLSGGRPEDPDRDLLIRLRARPEASASLRLHATERPDKLPFPPLPRDTRLRVFSRLRGCSALTLAWLGSPHPGGSRYCVYRRAVRPPGGPDRPPDTCLHPSARPRAEKVGCKSSRSSVTAQRVEGLRPGTAYRLDVYVSGPGQQPVRYQSKVVSTRRAC
uniref:Protein NDNF n=1 Tax=Callorhinchus milii TaxID=7868 RepID=A0A4W3HGS8_CALMI